MTAWRRSHELADKLYRLQDFTNDPNALQRAVDRGKEYVASLHFARSQMEPVDMENFTVVRDARNCGSSRENSGAQKFDLAGDRISSRAEG